MHPDEEPMRRDDFAAGASSRRCGHTLTIFHRHHGAWVIARDANLLASGV